MEIVSLVALSKRILLFSLWVFASSASRGLRRKSSPIKGSMGKDIVRSPYAEQACGDFHSEDRGVSGWLSSDCRAIWTAWTMTLEDRNFVPNQIRDNFNETSLQLRQEGRPCVVRSRSYEDGAGSASVRNLATWMVAEEMGCDWAAPTLSSERIDDKGTLMYCHKTVTVNQLHATAAEDFMGNIDPANFPDRIFRCEVVNWLEYFRFREHGITHIMGGKTKRILLNVKDSNAVLQARREYNSSPEGVRPWDNLHFFIGKIAANQFVQNVPSWDAVKRERIAGVVKKFRESFHEFPRPSYDHAPKCSYSQDHGVLDIALHVRLGDRKNYFHDNGLGHFEHLEAFMETVTEAVLAHGYQSPMFHVFSETSLPCPDDRGIFSEFPIWPVEINQVTECLTAMTPETCPEKLAGAPECNPDRSGIFRVAGKDLYLHVGLDVQNDLSCMIQADGILMGCSTFGQMAGVLGKGIKFFSFECSGKKTPNHYKMMPTLAVAEKGYMWVPISGSWHNPAIASRPIFEAALENYGKEKQEIPYLSRPWPSQPQQ